MAAGFKQATVNASDVGATLTDYPAYVDLSRLGITTQAEADSVRVYAESSKTTEWAREIVSATEMHVKVPSLTSTVKIFVDWDGVSADYGVTATYGRNNVWTGYTSVYHLQEDPSGSAPQMIDSTGNYDGTSSGSMTSGDSVAGKLNGNALDFDGSNDAITMATHVPSTAITFSSWVKATTYPASNSLGGVNMYADNTANKAFGQNIYMPSGVATMRHTERTSGTKYYYWNSPASASTGTWVHYVTTQTGIAATPAMYKDGVSQTVTSESAVGTPTRDTALSAIGRYGGYTGGFFFDADIDEVRRATTALSSDWVDTEYNNQSDESGFWGTWTDAAAATRRVFNIS